MVKLTFCSALGNSNTFPTRLLAIGVFGMYRHFPGLRLEANLETGCRTRLRNTPSRLCFTSSVHRREDYGDPGRLGRLRQDEVSELVSWGTR